MPANNYLWDENHVRYQLINSINGSAYNWLFMPGGPGLDSACFLELVQGLHLPGNTWLIDLPGNGSNLIEDNAEYNFDLWYEYFLPTVSKFPNPIYVGHSFGGMFPLFFPALEKILTGFVILNSAPCLWLEAAAKIAQEKNIPILQEPIEEFTKNPNPDTFKKALMACLPYYFPPYSLERGKALLENLPLNYHAANWWLRKVPELDFNKIWIPQHTPTLIINASEDCIVPYTLFENDKRFQRNNILYKRIEGAGHVPWVEKMQDVKTAFEELLTDYIEPKTQHQPHSQKLWQDL